MNVTCDTTSARIDLGKGNALQYIFNTGYHYRAGLSGWMPFTLTSAESLVASAWYPKTATASLSMNGTEMAADNYVLSYICS